MSQKIVIIDYGMGNLNSIHRKIRSFNIKPIISCTESDIKNADKIILPGVGHFSKAINNLKDLCIIDILNEVVLVKQKPIFGICLGMQLMTDRSEEGNVKGLGWINGKVVKFNISNYKNYKIPHIGWNKISISKNSILMNGIKENSELYFVHAYHLELNDRCDILNETTYEYKFSSALEKNNIFGVQYHPEKSHDDGIKILKNFIDL